MFRFFAIAVLIFALAMPSLGAESVNVGYVHVFDDAPTLVADKAGIFKEHDLDVKLTAFSSGTTLVKGLVTGELDIGILGFSNAFTWHDQGADLKIVGKQQMGYHALMARAGSGINTLADLKGKVIAGQKAGSTADIVFQGVVLPQGDLSGRDVRMVYTSPATALQSLIAGRVDAAFLFEPFARLAAVQGGATEVFEISKVWPFPCMVVVASKEFLERNPKALAAFLQANRHSVEFVQQNPAEAARILTPLFIPEGVVQGKNGTVSGNDIIYEAVITQSFDWRITPADLRSMKELGQIMFEQGILKQPIDLQQVTDLSWQEQLEAEGL